VVGQEKAALAAVLSADPVQRYLQSLSEDGVPAVPIDVQRAEVRLLCVCGGVCIGGGGVACGV
jgi:hypothetical protein